MNKPPNNMEREELLNLITGNTKSKHPSDWNNLLDEVDELLDDTNK